MSRSRAWCFTQHDVVNVDYRKPAEESEYLIVGHETCPTTKKAHHQGYIYFKNPRALGGVKKLLPGAHLEVARGTPDQNIKYCSKEGNAIEFGDAPKQGKRTDLDGVIEEIEANPDISTKDLITTYKGTWARNYKALDIVKSAFEVKRDWITEVIYLWGPTGSGKTKRAMEDGAVMVEFVNGFLLNYSGEDIVVFDDVDKWYFFKHRATVLKLLDRYPYSVNVKGGQRNWKPRKVYITSNYPPEETLCFDSINEVDSAVARRITETAHMTGTEVGAG